VLKPNLNWKGWTDYCSTRYLCVLGQNCLSRDGMDPRTDRALEYPRYFRTWTTSTLLWIRRSDPWF